MNQSADTDSTDAPPLSRRAALRQATVAEIKTLARQQLAEQGPGGLSLRAIARQMRTASSALYRYFASADDLVTTLCVDAYTSLADDLTAAQRTQPADHPTAQWWAIGHAYRHWALAHRADFTLIFGTPVPGYQAPADVTGPVAARATGVPLRSYADAVAAGAADPERSQVPPSLHAGPLLTTLLDTATPDYPPRLAGITLNAYASLLGFLNAEIFGSLTRLVDDTQALYRAHVHTVMLGMGFDAHILHDTVRRAS